MAQCKCSKCGLATNSKGLSAHWKELPHHANDKWLNSHKRYRNKAKKLADEETTEKESRPKTKARRHRVNPKDIQEKVNLIKKSDLELDDYEKQFMENMTKFSNGTWSPRMTKRQLNYLDELLEAAKMEVPQ